MFQGNWTCSKCGGAIKELPFEPRSSSGLTCRECYFKEKDGGSAAPAASAPVEDTGAAAEMDEREAPPFDPDAGATAGEPAPESPEMADAPIAEKKMFTGDWKCASCENAITELPFEPRSTDNLKCLDCFKKSKG